MHKKLDDGIKIRVINKPISKDMRQASDFGGRARAAGKESKLEKLLKRQEYLEKETSGRPGRRFALWFVALASAIFLGLSLVYMLSDAKVTITPRIENVALDENLSASKDSMSSPISFDLVVISGTEETEVKAGKKELLQTRAKGTAILYNAFSTSPQPLLVDTRLEGSNGKIYKTDKKLTIPGMAKDGTPGKVEVGIYASEPGEDYNTGPVDFKIYGFKGSPKYDKFYGRSKGSLVGGESGEFYVVPAEAKEKVAKDLESALRKKLFEKAQGQIPSGFIMFPDGASLQLNSGSGDAHSATPEVPVKLQGTLYGLLFDTKKLTKEIAKRNVDKYDDSDVYISNIESLDFDLSNPENIPWSDLKNINFSLKGPAKIVWRIDNVKLAAELAGKKKKDFNSIMASYPHAISADLILKPFWRMTLPESQNGVNIIINYPK